MSSLSLVLMAALTCLAYGTIRSADVVSPSYRVDAGYYRSPARGYSYYYNLPGVYGASAYATSGEYFGEQVTATTQRTFLDFVDAFRPYRVSRLAGDALVRSYIRYGSFDECLADFRNLRPISVRVITPSVAGLSGLLGSRTGVAERSYTRVQQEDEVIGYAGYLRNLPYEVKVIKSGCQLEGFPGAHNCIVVSDPSYEGSVRQFVYVDRQVAQESDYNVYNRIRTPVYVN
ncbi:hypothetical protein C0Q70_18303 [Pomacea canaliculata]|uniref:Uncharacterized protein n=1 Tax=Pomacea canaliculata TaxID=400727 RepID=A0A2T7NMT8_POMCA|nr:uncharacterized protein LOC112575447 [Pomacea canaliculata]PVD22489.1 hypothetical protein C0Q70_18303 [Pomacea canaliculata]